jgi:hypothetical protein
VKSLLPPIPKEGLGQQAVSGFGDRCREGGL